MSYEKNLDNEKKDKSERPKIGNVSACYAFGCPLPGSIGDYPGTDKWFCRHHWGTKASLWPEITGRVRSSGERPFEEPQQCDPSTVNVEEERRKINEISRRQKPGPKDWAWKLKAREEAGENLGLMQRTSWREALRHEVKGLDLDEARLEREAIQAVGA